LVPAAARVSLEPLDYMGIGGYTSLRGAG